MKEKSAVKLNRIRSNNAHYLIEIWEVIVNEMQSNCVSR